MGRIAVVTGGTRGIGAAISKALKAEGYNVVANYAGNDEAARSSRPRPASTRANGTSATTRPAPPASRRSRPTSGPVDMLVNNAGITRDAMFHKMTADQWYGVINTNLNSLFNMTRPVWDGMRERGFGRIICISSINGQKGQMGQVNYSAAKAGDIGFVKALAQEGAAKGITVNAICPGYIGTEMVHGGVRRRCSRSASCRTSRWDGWASPRRSRAASCSSPPKEAGFITGATLAANGGQYTGLAEHPSFPTS